MWIHEKPLKRKYDTTIGNRDGFTYGMSVTYTFHRLLNLN